MTWPFENDTRAIIRRLSGARLGQNRFRNRLIGMIIFMAAAILAFVASFAYNMTHEYAATTACQGIYQNLTKENLSLLKAHPGIQNIGIYQSVGIAEQVNGVTMGMVCSDATTMQLSRILLEQGQLPQAADELLVEKGYIDALHLKAGIGDTISVRFRNQAGRQPETKDFRITGFIKTTAEHDGNRTSYNAVVSRNFVRECPAFADRPVSAMISVRDSKRYTNRQLKDLIRKIGMECGIMADNIQVNSLYIDSSNLSKETVLTVLLFGIVLTGICSLVVYNIFNISVVDDVTSFGQLRTIGMTKKQVRQTILREENYLALHFLPFGCIAGGMLSFLTDKNAFQPLPDFFIALLSGTILFVCIRLSILKPARIAMSVSPVEAYRYNSDTGRKKIKKHRKIKKHSKIKKRLTPLSLAVMHLFRNRKKGILTFTSLVLSGMLFVGISSLLTSLDPEQRAKQSFPYEGSYVAELNRALVAPDFSLTDIQKNNLLTEELKNNILFIDGVKEVVCQQEVCVRVDGMETAVRSMNEKDYVELRDKVIDGILPDCDHTGENTLIINRGSPELEYLQKSYEVGDAVAFSQEQNIPQSGMTYTVAAIVSDKNSAASFLLPADEIRRTVPYNANSAFVIRTETNEDDRIREQLRLLVLTGDTLRLRTRKDVIMQYQSVFRTISAAVYALLAVVGMFSVVNLANTSMTGIISRRKETGLLRAVGLDSRQLSCMIGLENVFLISGSFLISLICGLFAGRAICLAAGNMPGFGFVEYTFPVVPVFLYFLIILTLQSVLTKWAVLYCRSFHGI